MFDEKEIQKMMKKLSLSREEAIQLLKDDEDDISVDLTPEQQKALVETGYEAGVYNNELQAKANDYYLDLMKKEGVTVVVPSEEVLEGFRAKAQDFYKLGSLFKWSDGLYEKVKAAMK